MFEPNIDEVTFNGLDRPAVFLGAPIRPLGICFIIITMISLMLSLICGLKSFLLMGIILPIFFILKFVCENDENALNVLRYSFKFFFLYRFNLNRLSHFTPKKNPIFKQPAFSPTRYGENDAI